MKHVKSFEWKLPEFYIFPTIVVYKNKNIDVKWTSIRFNIFHVEFEITFYFERNYRG